MATRFDAVYDLARQSRRRFQHRSHTTLQFLRRIGNPAIGAVAPSGRALAELIVSEIRPERGAVLEVGAGTGVFTAVLLERGMQADALTLIEADPAFATLLHKRFPGTHVINGRVEDVLGASGAMANTRFADAISGLPLLNFPVRTRRRILTSIFDHLADDGALYQFTYGPKSPVGHASLAELGLVSEPIGHVWRNLPPATVYRIRRRGQP